MIASNFLRLGLYFAILSVACAFTIGGVSVWIHILCRGRDGSLVATKWPLVELLTNVQNEEMKCEIIARVHFYQLEYLFSGFRICFFVHLICVSDVRFLLGSGSACLFLFDFVTKHELPSESEEGEAGS